LVNPKYKIMNPANRKYQFEFDFCFVNFSVFFKITAYSEICAKSTYK
jgi:hypothetical protein